MSEMFIPNSVWESSLSLKYGIFELIEADIIHEMMKDIFTSKVGIVNNYLIDPFSIRIQFAFRNWYNMNSDEYKYRIAVVNEKVRVNLNPLIIRDILKFNEYREIQSYLPDLKRFRPFIKV